ncbi:MAG: MOSC domain-containing protein [Actinomycetota bacterium]|nr:MOSC domain-containing protein [Actinomycetota bacterium]
MNAVLESVNLAVVLEADWKPDVGRTGIDKRPAAGAVQTGDNVLVGDTIADERSHGGPDQAVYAYAGEDAQWWSERLRRPVRPGAFGENLTTRGLDVTGAVIGERWSIGTAVFEVSRPRIPCTTFASFWDVADLIKQFTAAGRPGAYLRIASPGEIRAGDRITVEHRPAHGVTIGETFRAMTGDHSLAGRLLSAPELPDAVLDRARKWLAGDHHSETGVPRT